MATKTVTILNGQTLFDLSLQVFGDASRIYDLIASNPDKLISITQNNLTGLKINYEEENNEITNYFKTNNISIASQYPEFTKGKSFSESFNNSFN